jgi:hypothetical protein
MSELTDRVSGQNRRIAVAIGLLALAVYLATSALRFHSIDEIAVFTVARSFVARCALDSDVLFWIAPAMGIDNGGSIIAPGVDGHSYTIKDLIPSPLIVPLVWAAQNAGVSPMQASLLLPPLITALTASLIYYIARTWRYGIAAATLAALTFAFASMAFPYAETLFGQPFSALGLLIALHGTVRAREGHGWQAALLGGLGLGLAGLSTVPMWALIPLHALYLVPFDALKQRDRKAIVDALPRLAALIGGAGLCLILQGLYNAVRFGSPLATGHQEMGSASLGLRYLFTGMVGQLISAPRGIIWYAPFVLLIPFGVWIARHEPVRRFVMAGVQVAAVFLIYSSFSLWWSGVAFGPRYLAAVMPMLVLLCLPLFERLSRPSPPWWRVGTGLMLAWSVITQLMATLFDPIYREGEISPVLFGLAEHPGELLRAPVLWDWHLLPIPRMFEAAQASSSDVLWMQNGRIDWVALVVFIGLVLAAGLWLWRGMRQHLTWWWSGIGISVLTVSLMLVLLTSAPENAELEAAIDTLSEQAYPSDGVLALLPNSYIDWIDLYDGSLPDTGVVMESPLSVRTEELLERNQQWHDRVWLLSEGTTGGNPDNGVERWLSRNAFVGMETWIGGYRVVPYTFAGDALSYKERDDAFGRGETRLVGLGVETVQRGGGGWINVRLVWQVKTDIMADLVVFVHLLDAGGNLIAQHDGKLGVGYAATMGVELGASLVDQRTIMLSEPLDNGDYRFAIGLYDPVSGVRLRLTDGSGDSLIVPLD